MLNITILGSNNPHTDKLEKFARTAAEWVNPHMGYEVIRTNENDAALEMPALVINGAIVSAGRIPASQYIVTWISDAVQNMLEDAAGIAVEMPVLAGAYDQAAR